MMMLELHIWGPAFGLPSIDPQCLAAIAYLTCALDAAQWILVVGHEPASGLPKTYPLLTDGNARVSGFSSICSFLAGQGYSADSKQTPIQRANSAALTAHIQHTLQPLLDTLLYTTAGNYSTTRHSWSKVLPFYANYIYPPRRHAAAMSRTIPLGLSEPPPQLSDAPTDPDSAPLPPAYNSSPSLIFRRKQTVVEQLRRSQAEARFRIESLLEDAIGPLAARLKRTKFLVTDDAPCSIDCIAFGYLALMLKAKVEDRFISESLTSKYPAVLQYMQRLDTEFLGLQAANEAERMLTQRNNSISSGSTFRWRRASSSSFVTSVSTVSKAILTSVLNPSLAHYLSEQVTGRTQIGGKVAIHRRLIVFPTLPAIIIPIAAVIGIAGYVLAKSMRNPTELVFGRERPRLASLGAAGAALSILSSPLRMDDSINPGWQEEHHGFETTSTDGATIARIDVETSPRGP